MPVNPETAQRVKIVHGPMRPRTAEHTTTRHEQQRPLQAEAPQRERRNIASLLSGVVYLPGSRPTNIRRGKGF